MNKTLAVGLMHAHEITVRFDTPYIICDTNDESIVEGEVTLTHDDLGKRFKPANPQGRFTVVAMPIGIEFHWSQRRDLTFTGEIDIIAEKADEGTGKIWLVNVVDIEDYIKSVISSEMSPTASPALLRAHAVISRTWVVNRINRGEVHRALPPEPTPDEITLWYDENDHEGFTVCADDHCQRYQGISNGLLDEVVAAVEDTRGLILINPDGRPVDARFSKCCGGVTEVFATCWEDASHPCLNALRDSADPDDVPDLSSESGMRAWATSRPRCFCGDAKPEILAQVLKDYDLCTADYFRWSRTASCSDLGKSVQRVTGRDLGPILSMEALHRGPSGRISRLRLHGERGDLTIGKELLIRRALSDSCLYSSAFVADVDGDRITLTGAGWGHGVGLCQIGAAVMGALGYDWREILSHYYRGATLSSL